MKYESVVKDLLREIPEFKQSEMFRCVKGDIGTPYIIFGILKRFYIDIFNKQNDKLLKRMSDFLEQMAKSDDNKIKELLSYGFLENLDSSADYYKELVQTFGPETRKLLKETNKFWKELKKKNL